MCLATIVSSSWDCFLGLGFDKRRCFIISSVPSFSALPSDMAGWKFIQFVEPEEGGGPKADQEAVKALAKDIRDQIYSLKDYTTPASAGLKVITGDELTRLERPLKKGGQLVEFAEVLMNGAQPVEMSQQEFAAQVSLNIRAGITYRYVFHDLTAYPIIARLLYRIATTSFDEKGQ